MDDCYDVTDTHLAKKSADSFECFSTVCDHDYLNPDKDAWKDGKTALMRASEALDAYAVIALCGRKASVTGENRKDGNKTAIEYAKGGGEGRGKDSSEEEKRNRERVVKLLEAERDGTEEGVERFMKRLEEVELPKDEA